MESSQPPPQKNIRHRFQGRPLIRSSVPITLNCFQLRIENMRIYQFLPGFVNPEKPLPLNPVDYLLRTEKSITLHDGKLYSLEDVNEKPLCSDDYSVEKYTLMGKDHKKLLVALLNCTLEKIFCDEIKIKGCFYKKMPTINGQNESWMVFTGFYPKFQLLADVILLFVDISTVPMRKLQPTSNKLCNVQCGQFEFSGQVMWSTSSKCFYEIIKRSQHTLLDQVSQENISISQFKEKYSINSLQIPLYETKKILCWNQREQNAKFIKGANTCQLFTSHLPEEQKKEFISFYEKQSWEAIQKFLAFVSERNMLHSIKLSFIFAKWTKSVKPIQKIPSDEIMIGEKMALQIISRKGADVSCFISRFQSLPFGQNVQYDSNMIATYENVGSIVKTITMIKHYKEKVFLIIVPRKFSCPDLQPILLEFGLPSLVLIEEDYSQRTREQQYQKVLKHLFTIAGKCWEVKNYPLYLNKFIKNTCLLGLHTLVQGEIFTTSLCGISLEHGNFLTLTRQYYKAEQFKELVNAVSTFLFRFEQCYSSRFTQVIIIQHAVTSKQLKNNEYLAKEMEMLTKIQFTHVIAEKHKNWRFFFEDKQNFKKSIAIMPNFNKKFLIVILIQNYVLGPQEYTIFAKSANSSISDDYIHEIIAQNSTEQEDFHVNPSSILMLAKKCAEFEVQKMSGRKVHADLQRVPYFLREV